MDGNPIQEGRQKSENVSKLGNTSYGRFMGFLIQEKAVQV